MKPRFATSLMIAASVLLLVPVLQGCGKKAADSTASNPADRARAHVGSKTGSKPASGAVEAGKQPEVPETPPPVKPAPDSPGIRDHVADHPDRWYRIDREGKPVGFVHVNLGWVTQGGKRLVRDVTVMGHWYHRKISHMNDIFTTRSSFESIRGADGELFYTRSEIDQGEGSDARRIVSSLEKKEGGYECVVRMTRKDGQLGDEIRKKHKCDKTISLDSEAFLIPHVVSGAVGRGEELTYYVLEGERGTVFEMRARRIGTDPVRIGGKDEECVAVEVLTVARGESHREWYRPDGLLVKILQGDQTTLITTKEEIEEVRKSLESGQLSLSSPVRDSGLRTWPDLHGAFNLRSLLVEVTVQRREGVRAPPFEDSPFMEVVSRAEDGDGPYQYVLKLKQHRGSGKTATLPVDPKGFEQDLETTALMQLDSPEVQSAVATAIGAEKDALKASHLIAEYVFTKLDKESGTVGQYSAVEILRNGYGDCSEHALLFVAMCRAAGIPARQVSGFVCLGDQWGNHAWGEIWVGEWIGADACTCDVGTDARYVCFGYSDDPLSKSGVVSDSFTGYSRIKLLQGEFGDGEAVALNGRAETNGTTDKNVVFSHLAGVAFTKPEQGWTHSATSAGFRVSGRTLVASVSVRPDQGYRKAETSRRFAFGDGVKIQGFEAVQMQQGRSGAFFVVFADRRHVMIQVSLRSGSEETRQAEWKQFFDGLALSAWKGREVKPGGEYPSYESAIGPAPGGEPGDDEGEDEDEDAG